MATDDRWDDDRDRGRRSRGVVEDARQRVQGPAVALIVTAALGLLMLPYGIYSYLTFHEQIEEQRQKIDDIPNMPAQQKQTFKDYLTMYEDAAVVWAPINWAFVAVTSTVTLVGAVKMKNLSSRNWAWWGAVTAMLPCVTGCCILGLPFGIWALTVLGDADVKAGFAAARGRDDPHDPGFNDRY